MKGTTARIFFLLCLAGLGLAICFNLPNPTVSAQVDDVEVLILNSYHRGYGWADEVVQGIYDTLLGSGQIMNIHIEYMDAKRYPLADLQDELISLYLSKYDPKAFDLIILTDDNAVQFMFDYYEIFFQYVPVVFCGVGYLEEYDFTDYDNVTGYGEDSNFYDNLMLIEKLQPDIENVYFIAGSSPTGLAGSESFQKAASQYTGKMKIYQIANITIEETIERASQIPDRSAIIVMPFARDVENQFINWDSFLEMLTRSTNYPIYSSFSFQIIDHVVGGKVIDGYLHGQKTAERGLQILKGTPPSEFPIEYDGGHYFLFNYPELAKQKINVSELPAGSRLINEPNTVWYLYKTEIAIISIVFLSLVIFVFVLIMNINRRRSAEKRLLYLTSFDPMTGLYNRNAYVNELKRLQTFGSASVYPLGILYIDMNGLKKVNDHYGHERGDQYILQASRLLQEYFKEDSFIARIGGDEFIVIQENVQEDLWLEQISGLQQEIDEVKRSDAEINFGMAMGQVVCENAKLLEQAIHEADHFMYQNKYSENENIKKNTPG